MPTGFVRPTVSGMSGYTPGESGEPATTGYQRLKKPFTTPQLAHALSLAFQPAPVEQAPT